VNLQQAQKLQKPLDYMIYIFRMYQVIEGESQRHQLTLQGKLR
jgi:hypothetical protein